MLRQIMDKKDTKNSLSVTTDKVKEYLICCEESDFIRTEDACVHEKFTDTFMLQY